MDLHVNSEHVVQNDCGTRLRGDTGWGTNPDEAASVPHKLADKSLQFGVIPFLSTGEGSVSRASVDVEAAAAAGSGSGTVADVYTAAQDASIKALTDGNLPVAE